MWSALLSVIAMSLPVRVVVYGGHSDDWMAALGPGAPVWRRIGEVGVVLLIPHATGARLPKPARGVRTVVIPLMEDHIRHCPPGHASLIPDEHALQVLANKALFSVYMKANGLGHLCPQNYAACADAVFPCVLKRVDLNAGNGVAIVRSARELAERLTQEPWRGHPFILQSFIAGATEYVTHCVCRDGRILWHCSFACTLDEPGVIRGVTAKARLRHLTIPPAVLRQIESVLAPLRYSGPCNVDYKIVDDNIAVFEINPRLGGSLMRPENVEHLGGALSHLIRGALN